jgi:hypothetical protein
MPVRTNRFWRGSKAVMQRPAKPFRPVRLRSAPPNQKALIRQGFFFFRDGFYAFSSMIVARHNPVLSPLNHYDRSTFPY